MRSKSSSPVGVSALNAVAKLASELLLVRTEERERRRERERQRDRETER